MAQTLTELLAPKTADQVLAALLAKLQERDFPVTAWQEGGLERTMVESEADAQGDLWALVQQLAKGVHIDFAEGDWLRLLAKQRYNIDFNPATSTVGTIRLTCTASAGPYTITASQLQFKGAGGNLYRNTTGGTLNSGGTLDVTVVAEVAGADEGNDGADTILIMTTPLLGVTCTNPAVAFSAVSQSGSSTGTVTPSGTPSAKSWVVQITVTGQNNTGSFRLSQDGGMTFGSSQSMAASVANVDGSGLTLAFANGSSPSFNAGELYSFTSQGAWYTIQGTEIEPDPDLRARCKARWPQLSLVPTEDVYAVMAKAASSAVTKVRVYVDELLAAVVHIIIAGANGTVAGGVVTTVQAYVDARRPIGDVPEAEAAGTMAITLGGATVRVKAQNLATAQAAAQRNVQAYLGVVGIGDGSTVKVRYSQLIEAILRESGDEDDSVSGLTLNAGTVDLTVTADAVVTWAQVLSSLFTWTPY